MAPLPVAAGAALVAGVLTALVWHSPSYIAADIQPLILDFGQSRDVDLSRNDNTTDTDTDNQPSSASAATGSPHKPVRTQSSNGGLVLEWPRQRSGSSSSSTTDAKSEARRILQEAEDHLKAGDLRRALISARLAYSYPVEWQPDELSPDELLNQLETLASDPSVIASASRAAAAAINSANGSADSGPSRSTAGVTSLSDNESSTLGVPNSEGPSQKNSGIGVWRQAPASRHSVSVAESSTQRNIASATYNESDAAQGQLETVSAAEFTQSDYNSSPFAQPYQSQPEPGRLDIGTHQQAFESTSALSGHGTRSSLDKLDPRPLIITDQRTLAGQTESPIKTLTFEVLATLTTIFAVLFFGTLFLFLAVLAAGKKLLGENGLGFKIELVNNSPFTVQAGTAGVDAQPQTASEPVTNELKIDPDFEGILSMSEHRARERESAILQQFIENNVSLHEEINANRTAA